MTDFFKLPDNVPLGFSYAWLDLENRGWEDVEFLPNGWERVPYDRHADIFEKTPGGFVISQGLTLCEQPVLLEQQKQGLDWNAASNAAAEFERSFAKQAVELHLIPIPDAAGLQPLPGDKVVSTRKSNKPK